MYHMRIAEQEAAKSTHKHQLGAAIIRRNRVISKAFNMNKTHPVYGSGDYKMLHAEGHAIWKAVRQGIDLRGATIYVFRKNRRLAKPCPCCERMIQEHGIKKVYYTGS